MTALMACAVICACLALPDRTIAQETPPITRLDLSTSQTAPAQTDPNTSAALLRVIALRQELEAQVKALSRLVAYQKELLDLAHTSDVDAVLRARRQRQTCHAEINATALCDALSISFTDEPDRGDDR